MPSNSTGTLVLWLARGALKKKGNALRSPGHFPEAAACLVLWVPKRGGLTCVCSRAANSKEPPLWGCPCLRESRYLLCEGGGVLQKQQVSQSTPLSKPTNLVPLGSGSTKKISALNQGVFLPGSLVSTGSQRRKGPAFRFLLSLHQACTLSRRARRKSGTCASSSTTSCSSACA